MNFLDVMHAYFQGEKIEALGFIAPAAVLLFVLAGAAWRAEGGAFGIGLAVPLVLFGLVALGTGIGIGARTAGQVSKLESEFASSPARMVQAELPRMQKVNANWPRLVATWASLALIGLALRFGLKADWAHGVGPALVLIGAMGLLIDGFAERRARPYTRALESLAATHVVTTQRVGDSGEQSATK